MDNILFTTAPIDYDYGWNKQVLSNAGLFDKKIVRLISCHSEYHMNYQKGRYMSGMYFVCDLQSMKEELDYGHFTINDECRELIKDLVCLK